MIKKCKFKDLKVGDKFRLTPPNTKIDTVRGWSVVKVVDDRVYIRDREGSSLLKPNGEPTDYKCYCYLSQPVYKIEEDTI